MVSCVSMVLIVRKITKRLFFLTSKHIIVVIMQNFSLESTAAAVDVFYMV